MKAKEYAAKIIDKAVEAHQHAKANLTGKPDNEYHEYVLTSMVESALDAGMDLIEEITAASKLVKTEEAKIGKWREGITKWKSVVNQVHDKIIMHPVTVNYLGLLIAEDNPERFEILVRNKCFLGYELSNAEKEILGRLQDQRMKAERLRQFQAAEAHRDRMMALSLFGAIFMDSLRSYKSPNNPNNPKNW